MKISELIKLHGLPVKVRHPLWETPGWYEVIAQSRDASSYPAFDDSGRVTSACIDGPNWELFVEPTKKIKLEAYIINAHGKWFLDFGESGQFFSYINPGDKPALIRRAPQFDVEV